MYKGQTGSAILEAQPITRNIPASAEKRDLQGSKVPVLSESTHFPRPGVEAEAQPSVWWVVAVGLLAGALGFEGARAAWMLETSLLLDIPISAFDPHLVRAGVEMLVVGVILLWVAKGRKRWACPATPAG